ncbi:M48 family metallopeptidase [Luteolibacter flavescens]|uniref:M48 family metallopeptidase n=1 Tax=Luteolibacter flavescens TaxID=1859460 RepID=A0ABT3FUJ4_9BACT|nr:M48 family metallopeptidase [Luteolibacter flavescens]MCW1887222.1 M48 family metallopeptidase [Luteolibacter flavescens]
MSQTRFESLVHRLEIAWSDRPEGLLKRTVGWVSLGYGALAAPVLAGVMLVITGVVMAVLYNTPGAILLAGAIALAGLSLISFMLGCLWVRFEPPAGLPLKPKDHPELHRLLRDLGDLAGGVRFHQVTLNAEMNASVVQNPRIGFFGWYRAHLVIGVPLLEALPLDELRAVLAHEMGHLTRADGKTCTWLYRTRETWERVMERLTRNGDVPVVGEFFQWFWLHFNSRVLVLSRFSELAADQFAARAVSPETLASGLRRLAILGKHTGCVFWEPLDLAMQKNGDFPTDVMDRLSKAIRQPVEPRQAALWLAEAMAVGTGPTESHPGLARRLAALGIPESAACELPQPLPDGTSAADRLFAPGFLDRSRRHFSSMWVEESKKTHDERTHQQELEQVAGVRKAWDRIAALVRLDGLEKVQPEVMALLERQPAHSGALYLRGSHLAEKSDPTACDFLERATSDPAIASQAYEALERFHANQGRVLEAALIKDRAHQHDLELRAALMERSQLKATDSFLPHELCSNDLQALRDLLDASSGVKRALMVSKEVEHFRGWPFVVIALELTYDLTDHSRRKLETDIVRAWGGEAYVMVFSVDEETRQVLRALRRAVPESEVYRRK